jgi:hypothetical protein
MKANQLNLFAPEYQTNIFTGNEETGKQTTAERIKELQTTDHNFWNDPGHGWLEVQISDLKLLEIEKKISGYSYRKDGKAYLEEDCDASIYINALFPDLGDMSYMVFKSSHLKDRYQERIFVRALPHY